MSGYMIASVVYLGVLAVSSFRDRLAVRYDPLLVVPAVFLWCIFLVGLVRNPTGEAALRTAAYIVFSGLNLFVVPATFSREEFADALSIVAVVAVVLAIPVAIPALVYDTGQVGVWGDGTFPALTSVFTNPNDLAALSVLGFVAAIATIWSGRSVRWGLLGTLICALGILFARGRGALLGAVAAVVIIAVYKLAGRRAALSVVVLGVVAALSFVWVALSGVLGPESTRAVFNYRAGLWQAAVRAVADQPFVGYGPVDDGPILVAHGGPTPGGYVRSAHSSYFRMFVMTGVLGGVVYLLLCAGAIGRGLQTLAHPTAVARFFPLTFLAVVLVLGLFNNSPIFGLNFIAVLGSLAVGYTASARYTMPL